MNPGGMTHDPLSALRPIHSPPPVSWWPPAPGWWLLLVLVCVLVIWSILWYLRGRMKRAALKELRQIEDNASLSDREFAAQVSAVLKRYALYCFPRQDVAALTGKAWLEFLDSRARANGFVSGPGRVLAGDVYGPECRVDRKALAELARRWIRRVRPSSSMFYRKNTAPYTGSSCSKGVFQPDQGNRKDSGGQS